MDREAISLLRMPGEISQVSKMPAAANIIRTADSTTSLPRIKSQRYYKTSLERIHNGTYLP